MDIKILIKVDFKCIWSIDIQWKGKWNEPYMTTIQSDQLTQKTTSENSSKQVRRPSLGIGIP